MWDVVGSLLLLVLAATVFAILIVDIYNSLYNYHYNRRVFGKPFKWREWFKRISK